MYRQIISARLINEQHQSDRPNLTESLGLCGRGEGVRGGVTNARALSLLLLLAITVSGAGSFTSEWSAFSRGSMDVATCRVTADQVSMRAVRMTARQRITPRLTARGEIARPAKSLAALDSARDTGRVWATDVLSLTGPAWRTTLPPPAISTPHC